MWSSPNSLGQWQQKPIELSQDRQVLFSSFFFTSYQKINYGLCQELIPLHCDNTSSPYSALRAYPPLRAPPQSAKTSFKFQYYITPQHNSKQVKCYLSAKVMFPCNVAHDGVSLKCHFCHLLNGEGLIPGSAWCLRRWNMGGLGNPTQGRTFGQTSKTCHSQELKPSIGGGTWRSQ